MSVAFANECRRAIKTRFLTAFPGHDLVRHYEVLKSQILNSLTFVHWKHSILYLRFTGNCQISEVSSSEELYTVSRQLCALLCAHADLLEKRAKCPRT